VPCDVPSAVPRASLDGSSRSKALSSQGPRAFSFARGDTLFAATLTGQLCGDPIRTYVTRRSETRSPAATSGSFQSHSHLRLANDRSPRRPLARKAPIDPMASPVFALDAIPNRAGVRRRFADREFDHYMDSSYDE